MISKNDNENARKRGKLLGNVPSFGLSIRSVKSVIVVNKSSLEKIWRSKELRTAARRNRCYAAAPLFFRKNEISSDVGASLRATGKGEQPRRTKSNPSRARLSRNQSGNSFHHPPSAVVPANSRRDVKRSHRKRKNLDEVSIVCRWKQYPTDPTRRYINPWLVITWISPGFLSDFAEAGAPCGRSVFTVAPHRPRS